MILSCNIAVDQIGNRGGNKKMAIIRLQNSPGDESKIKRKGTRLIRIKVMVFGKLNVSRLAIIIYSLVNFFQ